MLVRCRATSSSPKREVLHHLNFAMRFSGGVLPSVAVLFLAVSAFAEPLKTPVDFSSVTNFSRCPGAVRNDFVAACRKAITAGDTATFKALIDILAKDKDVTPYSFDCWRKAGEALVDDALAQRKKTPAERKVIAGGEGGSTFGLWQGPMEIDGVFALDRLRLSEATELLLKVMPQEKLPLNITQRRDAALLDYQVKAGDNDGRLAAARRVSDFLFKTAPAALAGDPPLDRDGTNAVFAAAETLFKFHQERGEWPAVIALSRELAAKLGTFYGDRVVSLKGYELAADFRMGDDAAYAAFTKELDALPFTPAVFQAYMKAADIIGKDNANNGMAEVPVVLARVRARSDLDNGSRAALLETLFYAAERNQDMTMYKDCYNGLKALYDSSFAESEAEKKREAEARAAKQPYQRKSVTVFQNVLRLRQRYVDTLFAEKDYKAAIPVAEWFVRDQPKNDRMILTLATMRLFAGQKKESAEGLASFVTNEVFSIGQRFTGRVLQIAATAPDEKVFREEVAALRKLSDSAAKDGETDAESDARYFNCLRAATRQLFFAGADQKQIGFMLALQEMSDDLKHPEVRLTYTAKYYENAPRTAEGALATGLFDKVATENRLGPYSTYSSIDKNAELKLLKSLPPPHLAADKPGHEAAVAVVYDTHGVHVYIRGNDPDAAATRDGYANASNFELTIMPGEMTSYHQTFFSARYPKDTNEIEWDMPVPGRKLTRDYIVTDAVSTENCHAFHVFAPWLMFYTRMPKNGDTWRMVLVGRWGGERGALGGGSVHELGRGMQVKFDIPADVAAKVREGLVKSAAGEYQKVRSLWENADFWSDPHMGDEAFYAEVVKPFLADLDEKAKLVTDGKLTNDVVEMLSRDYLHNWIDFRLALDGKRAKWIEDRLFK